MNLTPSKMHKLFGGLVLASAALLGTLNGDEGVKHIPYRDIGGVWTVCVGHTGKDIIPGKWYSSTECNILLSKDVKVTQTAILACTNVPLNQNQLDAFSNFAFNVGPGNYCNTSIAANVNAGNIDNACRRLMLYDVVNKRHVASIAARRKREMTLCLKPVTPTLIAQN